jgi:manganese/zinc/iron transport system substrate-binding protein
MFFTHLKVYLTAAFLILLLAGCGPASAQPGPEDLSSRPINVVATTGMITDIIQNVGGSRVDVEGLMGPGIDPHLYKASAGDVSLLQNADIIFYNGLHLEAAMAGVLERMNDRQVRTVAVTDGIDRELLLTPPEFEGAYDPHIWFDVSLWQSAVHTVRDAFIELDPANEKQYEENAKIYLDSLQELHEYVLSQVERIPPDKRALITAHDAFNYFGRAYGFEVRGLQGISTASEAGTADVTQLTDFIVENQIPAIFVETSVPQRNIEAVLAAVRDRGFEARIGGSLYSDAMGNPGTPEGTYQGMVRHNIDTIVAALTGN